MTPPGGASPIPCPKTGCSVRFECDACLHEHLRSVHSTTYGHVYGYVPDAWMDLCPGHHGFPLDQLTDRQDPKPPAAST